LSYDGQSFFEEKIWMPLFERSTKFEQLKHLTGWGGLYEMTPDKTAILGVVEAMPNVFENHGYSGRGAMQSYAAGRGLAELLHFGAFQTLDLSSMTGSRFKTGALIPEGLHI
jgi:sarcosine oxidase